MDIGYFLILPLYPKSIHKDYHKICELFWDIKSEICIFGKTPKINSHKTLSQFTQQPYEFKELVHNKIQRLNYVMGYFNVKKNQK